MSWRPVIKQAGSEPDSPRLAGEPSRPLLSLVGLFVLTAVLLPSSSFLIAWALIVVTNNLDVAHALGISDVLVTGLVIAGSGLVTGLVVALVSSLAGWKRLSPPVAGLVVGLGIYLGFVAFEPREIVEIGGLALITIGVGQASAIVASTRLTGLALVAVVPSIVVLGIGAAGFIQAIPAAPAEVLLVLDVYTVDETTGVCSGVEELAGVVEGSSVSLLELPEVSGRTTQVGSVVLPEGFEGDGGCMFELGNPLGRPAAGYDNIDFLPESDPGVPYGIRIEGNRVIVNLERAEG
jgi:hypothetical protein